MSNYFTDQVRTVDMGSLNLGAGAATVVFQPGKPVDIKRLILIVTTAQATAGAVLTVGTREADGSGGEVVIGTATTPATMALNSVFVIELAGVSTDPIVTSGEHSQPAEVTMGRVDGYYSNRPGGVIEIDMGRELYVTSGGEGDTGVATVYAEYFEQGIDRAPDPTNIAFVRS